jgi:hypothetical protein
VCSSDLKWLQEREKFARDCEPCAQNLTYFFQH